MSKDKDELEYQFSFEEEYSSRHTDTLDSEENPNNTQDQSDLDEGQFKEMGGRGFGVKAQRFPLLQNKRLLIVLVAILGAIIYMFFAPETNSVNPVAGTTATIAKKPQPPSDSFAKDQVCLPTWTHRASIDNHTRKRYWEFASTSIVRQ